MKNSEDFTKDFLEKIDSDEYKKELCPKPEFVMTDELVEEEVEKYNILGY